MSKQKSVRPLSLAIGATFAATLAAAPVQADVNPFGMSALASGYMVADSSATEGKCGSNPVSSKATEAECGANKASAKVSEAECGANKTTTEPVAKPIVEAKCGEAKCGSNK